MKALSDIAADLRRLADEATAEHPIDPHDVRLIAMRVIAQAEIIEMGLHE